MLSRVIAHLLAATLLLAAFPHPATAAFEEDLLRNEVACPGGDCGNPGSGMRYLAFQKILEARYMLAAYDECLSLARTSPDAVAAVYLGDLNTRRGEVLDLALEAFYLCGPLDFRQSSEGLFRTLQSPALSFPHYQWPASLNELVDSGLLSHLPASPFSDEFAVSSELTALRNPGDLYYRAIPTREEGEFLLEAGGLESMLLLIAGKPGPFVMDFAKLEKKYVGDLSLVAPVVPENIVYICGQYYDQ